MNRIVDSFQKDSSYTMLKQAENCYIFKDNIIGRELKISIINDDKVSLEFKDHFDE